MLSKNDLDLAIHYLAQARKSEDVEDYLADEDEEYGTVEWLVAQERARRSAAEAREFNKPLDALIERVEDERLER